MFFKFYYKTDNTYNKRKCNINLTYIQPTKRQTSAAINSQGYPLIGPTTCSTTQQKGAGYDTRAARVQRAHPRHLANRKRATSIEWK